VGTEPYSATTRPQHGHEENLTNHGIEVIEIERKSSGTDARGNPNYISATKIREAIREDNLTVVLDFLPPCTQAYLQSTRSESVRAKLRE
jgi:[citrate (pro-3S)-lyase] ligase